VLLSSGFPHGSGLPCISSRSAFTLPFSRLAQRSLSLRPVCSLTRQAGLLRQGLQRHRCLRRCLGCYRLERAVPGGSTSLALPLGSCTFPRRTETCGLSRNDLVRSLRLCVWKSLSQALHAEQQSPEIFTHDPAPIIRHSHGQIAKQGCRVASFARLLQRFPCFAPST